MRPNSREFLDRLPAVTLLVALMSVGTSVHAVDTTCHLALYHLGDAPSDREVWESLGYTIDVDRGLADYTPARVAAEFYRRPPGTALVFTTATDFSLMLRPTWRDDSGISGASTLSLNRPAFLKAYARPTPSCADLRNLVNRAEPRYRASLAALKFLKGDPAGKDFSWSDFLLSYENAMYLRDGFAIDSLKLMRQQGQWRDQLRTAARKAGPGLDGVARLTSMIYAQSQIHHYCAGGNTFSSTQLMRCTACQGSTEAIIAGLKDSGLNIAAPYELGVQTFKDHWRPVLWDAKNWRFKDLTAGGGWITEISDPIYRPEYLVDRLLRSPISGLTPEVVQAQLPERGPYDFVIADAGEETSKWPVWLQRKWKQPPPFAYYLERSRPNTGIARYVPVLARSNYGNDDSPRDDEMVFRDFDESIEPNKKVRGTTGSKAEWAEYVTEPNTVLLRLLELSDLPEADKARLEPLKAFAEKNGQWRWTKQAYTPAALALQASIVKDYTVGALAKRLGEDRLSDSRAAKKVLNPQNFRAETYANYVPKYAPALEALSPRPIMEQMAEVDRILNSAWRESVSDATFRELVEWLNRPVSSAYQFDVERARAFNAKIDELIELASAYSTFQGEAGPIHPEPSVFREGNGPTSGLITAETQALVGAAAAHGDALVRAHRRVVEASREWTPEQTIVFAALYIKLGILVGQILWKVDDEPIVRARWTEFERNPEIFLRHARFPLQDMFETMLDDPDHHYVSARDLAKPRRARPERAPGPDVNARRINLPVVNFGRDLPCAGTIGAGVAVECPDKPTLARVDEALTPEFTYALMINQAWDSWMLPSKVIQIAALFSDDVEAVATKSRVVHIDSVHEIFSPNPLLISVDRARRASVDARACVKTERVAPDWACVTSRLGFEDTQFVELPSLDWLKSNPEYQRAYARWTKLVKRFAVKDLGKRENDDARVSRKTFAHVNGSWEQLTVVINGRAYTVAYPKRDATDAKPSIDANPDVEPASPKYEFRSIGVESRPSLRDSAEAQ